MEFWGLEVKPGQTVKVAPEDDHFLHLSQGALGEVKKDEKATMFIKVDNQKLAIGTLSQEKFPQITFDLVFEKEFELSHTSKSNSVFFSGYKVFQPAEGDEMDFDSEEESDEEEELKVLPAAKENGKAEAKDKEPKQVKIAAKPKADAKAAAGKSKKDDSSDDDDESDDSDDDSEGQLIPIEGSDDSGSEEDGSDDSDDDDESDDEEEEETPKKVETGKKRLASSAVKTPASDKKAKVAVATPSGQKTGDKKGAVHVATPHPAKKAGKTPATNEKSPKSGGSVVCKSCPKTFNSENALAAHSNAKHKAAAK